MILDPHGAIMTRLDLVDMNCPYCAHECDARKGEELMADRIGRTLQYRHIVCPGERERALRHYQGKETE